ncbi:hypothetical protein SALBM311S_09218 [Streptomyces alboniger]
MSIRRGRAPSAVLSVCFDAVSATTPILPRATDSAARPPPTAAPETAPHTTVVARAAASPASIVVTGSCEYFGEVLGSGTPPGKDTAQVYAARKPRKTLGTQGTRRARDGNEAAQGRSGPGRAAGLRAKARGRGNPGHRAQPAHGAAADGRQAHRADPPAREPEGRLRLPGLRLAGAGAPARGGVLRERREGGRRGGHPAPGHPRVLRHALRRRPRHQERLLAGTAGPAHPPRVPPRRGNALRAGDLGARLRHRRRGDHRPRLTRRGPLLHLRPHQQRGRLPLPALRARTRHQQPAGLLQHVPRVVRLGPCRKQSASARAASCWRTSTRPT